MTLFHLHDDLAAAAGDRRFTFARASVWLAMTLKTIHEAIVAARTRGQQRELLFHGDFGGESPDIVSDRPLDEQEIGKIPQQPMILGDKWDC
jgi:hypothetical protein